VRIPELPSALDRRVEITERLDGRLPAVFLDYDGTLTPIVDDPAAATLPDPTRAAVVALSSRCPVAVVSGRDLADVRAMVGADGVAYAGSHGLDILDADGRRHAFGEEFLPALDRAEEAARAAAEGVPGASVERKRFAVAVHLRRVPPERRPQVERAVKEAAARVPGLRSTGGKMITELRPDVPWDKGRAVRFLLEAMGLDRPGVAPLYVGDDETDEDAFREVREDGIGVVVRGEDDDRPTLARYSLRDPDQVREFLEGLPQEE
jgi:trehalose-phosphatase